MRASKLRSTTGVVGVLLLSVLLPRALAAQCPDGSTPPCTTRSSPVTSLAVLYFESRSPDTTDAYLSDGLTEEVIRTLSESNG